MVVEELTDYQKLIDLAESFCDGILITKNIYDRLVRCNVTFKFNIIHIKRGVINHMARESKMLKFYKAERILKGVRMTYHTPETFAKISEDEQTQYDVISLDQLAFVIIVKSNFMTYNEFKKFDAIGLFPKLEEANDLGMGLIRTINRKRDLTLIGNHVDPTEILNPYHHEVSINQ